MGLIMYSLKICIDISLDFHRFCSGSKCTLVGFFLINFSLSALNSQCQGQCFASFGNFILCKSDVRANGCFSENFFPLEWKFQHLY